MFVVTKIVAYAEVAKTTQKITAASSEDSSAVCSGHAAIPTCPPADVQCWDTFRGCPAQEAFYNIDSALILGIVVWCPGFRQQTKCYVLRHNFSRENDQLSPAVTGRTGHCLLL